MTIGVLDLFSGCGGTSAGFAAVDRPDAEIRILGGVDFDEHSCQTFERNLKSPAFREDVRRLAEDETRLRDLVTRIGADQFDRFVLIGCAPCQGFAAHRKAVLGGDTRRHLFLEFARIASTLRPDAILMENVPDLFSKRHWRHYVEGRRILDGAGYKIRSRIYNFAEFGLPQERFRAVMLAFKHDFPIPKPLFEPQNYRTVRDAIHGLAPLGAGQASIEDPMHVVSSHRESTVRLLAQVPKDGGNRPVGVGPACLDRARQKHGGYTDVYGRLAWDRPAVTITARCRTPSCGRFAHPEQDRGLSVREAALLQGFPKDFVFEGPFDDKFKQIGNAVPPLVARVFADHMIDILINPTDAVSAAATDDKGSDITAPIGPGFAVTINGIKKRRRRLEAAK